SHLVARYGAARIGQWRFEVWNEPDIPNYWKGSQEEYCALYNAAVEGVTGALPEARIGGPATTAGGTDFLRAVLPNLSRLDFASFHAKGAHYTDRRHYNVTLPVPRESPSLSRMLEDVRRNVVAIRERFPDVPILVDECDPAVGTIYGIFDNPNFVVCNSTYYASMLCALAREVLDLGEVELFTSWAFYFEGKRWFEGNRALVTNDNVELPVLDGFRMLERLGDQRVQATGAGVGVLAGNRSVIVYDHTDNWWQDGTVKVDLKLTNAGPGVRMSGLGDAYSCWLAMGSPQAPSSDQVARMKEAGQLQSMGSIPAMGGVARHRLELVKHQAILCEVLN
ncbi:MAG: GH39 family glycosyl hydrolase, partial [Chloroflexota bacterium]